MNETKKKKVQTWVFYGTLAAAASGLFALLHRCFTGIRELLYDLDLAVALEDEDSSI